MYHILIVDEEEHLLWALERNLFPQRQDVQVHTAISGEAGLELLERQAIDLLISDIKMPGAVDGFQLILRAKEMVPDARVMIITAFGTHRIQNFAERIGISHYIEKPFTVDELRSAILEILDEKEGFQGVLSDLELTDIIQMLCLARRTALLHLKHREHRGRIVFENGEVTHAEFDGLQGPEAIYEMLDLRQGDIFMQSDFEPTDRTVTMGWQDLLLEGVRRADERRMEATSAAFLEEQSRASEAEDDTQAEHEHQDPGSSSHRTRTPIGMGIPMLEEHSDFNSSFSTGMDESSAALLFSDEELEEMAMVSEAAAEAETENHDGPAPLAEISEPETIVMDVAGLFMPEEAYPEGTFPADRSGQVAYLEDEADQGGFFDTPSQEYSPPPRRRHSTSPGMAALTQGHLSEESGEYELFAAPALNGRHIQLSQDEQVDHLAGAFESFLQECPGLKASALVDPKEERPRYLVDLTEGEGLREGELSARVTLVFDQAMRSVRALFADDNLREMQLSLPQDYVLVRALGPSSLLHIAVVDRHINLGIALVLMRQLERQVQASAEAP